MQQVIEPRRRLWTPRDVDAPLVEPCVFAPPPPPFGAGNRLADANIKWQGWNPGLLAGLVLWLRGDSIVRDPTDLSKVSSWNDKSVNAHNTAVALITQRPTYSAAAINGKPGATFDGALTFLRSFGTNTMPALTNLSVWVVAKPTATAAGIQYGMIGFGAWTPAFGTYGNNPFYTHLSPYAFNSWTDKTVAAGMSYLFEYKRGAGPAWNMLLNGGLSTLTYTTAFTTTPLNWGYGDEGPGSSPHVFLGDICEIVVIDHTATALEESNMHAYSQSYYATA